LVPMRTAGTDCTEAGIEKPVVDEAAMVSILNLIFGTHGVLIS